MKHRILIADSLAPEGRSYLESQPDTEVSVATGLSGEKLADALASHDGVVIRSSVQITGDVLDHCMGHPQARLRGVARAGVGVDNVDITAATRHGVVVMNSASASTITTAEHAFALMLALARNIGPAYATMRSGGWDRKKFVGHQLHGRTVGIVGMGRIGRTVAQFARAFGMNVLGYDPMVNAETLLDGQVTMLRDFNELIEQVDIISFHVPKTEQTRGMLGAEQFRRARAGLLVINAARGGIIDEPALLEALDSGQCGGAAIDVFETEPPASDDPLRGHPRVLTTPHLGASTVEAQEAVAVDACKALLTYLRGEGIIGAVNIGGLSLDMSDRQRAFASLATRMMSLLRAASGVEGLSGIRITVRGGGIAGRADTITRYAVAELLRQHLDEPVNLINAGITAEQRNIVVETTIAADRGDDRIVIELTDRAGTHRAEGAIYDDGQPRITQLDGYAMDMVPEGHMILLTNRDEPGRIGLVGQLLGEANVNIAEMVIGRKPSADQRGQVAMMILKLDEQPGEATLERLRSSAGILRVIAVDLPAVSNQSPTASQPAREPLGSAL